MDAIGDEADVERVGEAKRSLYDVVVSVHVHWAAVA